MTALSPTKGYRSDTYKICDGCKKSSPKGLRFDLDDPITKRKWLCDRCTGRINENNQSKTKRT